MTYRPGYAFRVSARFRDGVVASYSELWHARFRDRTPATLPMAVLDDGELVTVIANDGGALVVRRADGRKGYLG